MKSCKNLWLKILFSYPLIVLILSIVIYANSINSGANEKSTSRADHDHRLAVEIAALMAHVVEDSCAPDCIYPCNLAPTPFDLKICLQLLKWDKGVEKLLKTNGFRHHHHLSPISPASVLNKKEMTSFDVQEKYNCMELMCLCPLVNGAIEESSADGRNGQKCILHDGSTLQKAVRKEYRMLTKEERRALRDSIIWSEEFLGDIDEHGGIKDGKFSHWTDRNKNRLTRTLNDVDPEEMIDRKIVEHWMEANELAMYSMEICKSECVNKDGSKDGAHFASLEHMHNSVHGFVGGFVGGTMHNPRSAPNDPTFYFLHAFIDYIWEKWRQKRETKDEQESKYPEEYIECCKQGRSAFSVHSGEFGMMPFNETAAGRGSGHFANGHFENGLSTKYTDPETGLFHYVDRPECSAEHDCNSESVKIIYLFVLSPSSWHNQLCFQN